MEDLIKMGRNKLSVYDKNKKYNLDKLNEIVKYSKGENEWNVLKDVLTIRSKALQDLCLFSLMKSRDVFMDLKNTPKELMKITGWSERKIYDLIKTIYIISNSIEAGFRKIEKGGVDLGQGN